MLTIFVGAVVGALVGVSAKKFIVEIDAQIVVSPIKLVRFWRGIGRDFFVFNSRAIFKLGSSSLLCNFMFWINFANDD